MLNKELEESLKECILDSFTTVAAVLDSAEKKIFAEDIYFYDRYIRLIVKNAKRKNITRGTLLQMDVFSYIISKSMFLCSVKYKPCKELLSNILNECLENYDDIKVAVFD